MKKPASTHRLFYKHAQRTWLLQLKKMSAAVSWNSKHLKRNLMMRSMSSSHNSSQTYKLLLLILVRSSRLQPSFSSFSSDSSSNETIQLLENKFKEKSTQVTECLKSYHTQISKYSKVLDKVWSALSLCLPSYSSFLFLNHQIDPRRISFRAQVLTSLTSSISHSNPQFTSIGNSNRSLSHLRDSKPH